MTRTRIKICGVRDEATAETAVDAGADAIGLIFVRSSPRFVEVDQAREIAASLPAFVTPVGVFADAPPDDVQRVRSAVGLGAVQLHGAETETDAAASGPGVIKAIQFRPEAAGDEIGRWARAPGVMSVLVDGSAGGQGRRVDWEALRAAVSDLSLRLILAGGLAPENVGQAIAAVHPYAVDVTSGVEARRGEKDPGLVRAFCQAVRQADASR